MGLVEAEQWWERWQLRVLVLGSLSLQLFLLVAAALRRRRTRPWLRLLTWAAYMGSDALAIYALAMLFTRRKKQQQPSAAAAGGSAELEALWAPVLLLHLGGQDGITAYSIQDKELWRRHMLTAASQVAIAVYVFRKSWPQGGDGRVLAAAILIFFPGILKCLGKPWALSKSSTSSTAATVGAKIPKQQDTNDDTNNRSVISSIEEFVHEASLVYASSNGKQEELVGGDDHDHQEQARLLKHTHHLFVDLPFPYSVHLELLRHVWQRGPMRAHRFVRSGLSRTFDRLYTGGHGYGGGYLGSALLRAVLVLLLASAMAIVFVTSRSRGAGAGAGAYATDANLNVTYVLLCCTAGLEVVSAVTMVYFGTMTAEPPWPDQVAQCNLIGYLVHNETAHRWVRSLAALLGCQPYLDWLWCTAPSRTARPSPSCSSDGITDLIFAHIAYQWRKPPDGDTTSNVDNECYYIKDTASYRRFSGSRGEWTLGKESCGGAAAAASVERPFDESVMVWHLATDMCFFHSVGDERREGQKRQCRAISNYMAYLLLVNPEMLMPGARRRVFTVAYCQVRETIVEGESAEDEDDDGVLTEKKKVSLPPGGSQDMARKLMQKVRTTTRKTADKDDAGGVDPPRSRNLVHDAWVLAKELMEMEDKTWKVISGVWVEMLCFSASRCRGYLHAKSLAAGGEYLSYVWLLRAFMGMDTLAHAMQATEEGDLGAAHPPTVLTAGDHAA